MNVYGPLVKAQLENLAADPTPGIRGRVIYNYISGTAKVDTGVSWIAMGNTAYTAPTLQKFTSTGTTSGYVFTVSGANASIGDVYKTPNGNSFTVTANISAAALLWCSGASAPNAAANTLTKFSGSGDATIAYTAFTTMATYTKPAGVLYLRVRAVGGGGGGGNGGNVSGLTNGAAGGATYFASASIQAFGGAGGVSGVAAGGTSTITTGATGQSFTGASGGGYFSNDGSSAVVYGTGGFGGNSPFGGAGAGQANGVGSAAAANTGSGGGGGGYTFAAANQRAQSGGGAGGFVDAFIFTPASIYYYAVGAAGLGATPGSTNGFAGGNGGAGLILVEEYYQ